LLYSFPHRATTAFADDVLRAGEERVREEVDLSSTLRGACVAATRGRSVGSDIGDNPPDRRRREGGGGTPATAGGWHRDGVDAAGATAIRERARR
jgi:hypothetical protein